MIQLFNKRSQRTKNMLIGSSSLVISRVLTALLGFVTTGMIARYLTGDEFGLWALLISMPGLFGGFDLGFSNSLKNKLSLLFGANNEEEEKKYYFSIFYGLVFLASILAVCIFYLKPFMPWEMLFNLSLKNLNGSDAQLFNINLFVIVACIPFSIALSAGFFSYQESYFNSMFSFLVSVLTIIALYALISLKSTFFYIGLMFILVGLFVYILSFFVFMLRRKWGFIKVNLATLAEKLKELSSTSIQFVLLQIPAGILFSIDPFIVSKISGLSSAGDYFLIKKICVLALGIHAAALLAVWPIYTEAISKRDIAWVRKILKYTAIITFAVFIVFTVLLYLFGARFTYLWTGKEIHMKAIFFLLGIWSVLFSVGTCFSVFLNSFGNLKLQLLISGMACIIVIPLSLHWGRNYGITGICWAQVVLVLPVAVSNMVQSIINVKSLALIKT